MRILILSTYYAPEHTGNAPYVTHLARHLSQSHDVTVIASHPHYPEWEVPVEWAKWRTVERDGRLTVIRLSHYVPKRQDFIRRLAYELAWAARGIVEARRHRADVVLGVTPTLLTSHVGRLAARRNEAKLTLMVQDIVSRAAAQSGIKGGRRAAKVTAWIERTGLSAADGVATIHPRFAEVLEADYGVQQAALKVIYNWSHISLPSADRASKRTEFGWSPDEIVVLHSGNMGNKQYLDNVIEAAKVAARRQLNIRFVMAGDGNQKARLEALGADVPTLEIRTAVGNADFPDFLAAADVLLVNERAGVFEMSVPSKLTSYLAAGRPVLAATEDQSATAELLLASGGGVLVEPENPEAMVDSVLSLTEDSLAVLAMGKRGRQFAIGQLGSASALAAYQSWLETFVDP